uniref:Photosystem I assembly protein Ycf4 n=1 Tax=Nicotiana sylvestris TaxID=4096 RepID=A0A1U7X7P5_NICSY
GISSAEYTLSGVFKGGKSEIRLSGVFQFGSDHCYTGYCWFLLLLFAVGFCCCATALELWTRVALFLKEIDAQGGLYPTTGIRAQGVARGTLYMTTAKICQSELNAAQDEISADLWHKRMDHMSEKGLHLARKSLISYAKKFHALVERETGRKLNRLRSDNGGPGTPKHNGVAKRMNRTIMEKLPLTFDIPDRVWTNTEVSYSHLKVFGCRAFAHVPKEQRTKLDDKSVPCIFIVYGDEEFGKYDRRGCRAGEQPGEVIEQGKQLDNDVEQVEYPTQEEELSQPLRRSERPRIESCREELITGSRKISNFCWAFILFLGSLGFLLVGTSSYLGRNLISFFPPQQIIFFPQGLVMSFYGIAGLFISSYLWCTISWNVGSGYDRFDRKEGIVCIFRWGFPGKNRRIFLRFLIKDIQSVRIEVKEGISARRVLYMDIRGQGSIPLTRTDENLTPREIEQKAAELAYFLRVPIEVF